MQISKSGTAWYQAAWYQAAAWSIRHMPDQIRRQPDQSGCCLIKIRQLPDRSGTCQIKIRQQPDRSGCCLIKIRQLPDWSGPWFVRSLIKPNRQEQTCLQWSSAVVEQYGSIIDMGLCLVSPCSHYFLHFVHPLSACGSSPLVFPHHTQLDRGEKPHWGRQAQALGCPRS